MSESTSLQLDSLHLIISQQQKAMSQQAKEIEELKSKLHVAIDVYRNIEAQDASRIQDLQTQATLWKSEAHKISIAYDMAEKEIESLKAELATLKSQKKKPVGYMWKDLRANGGFTKRIEFTAPPYIPTEALVPLYLAAPAQKDQP